MKMGERIISKKFFLRKSPFLAPWLIGKILVRKIGRRKIYCLITETEAYEGKHDKASHAWRGKTQRNQVMFEKGGRWYVYFVYGNHWMLNVVSGPLNYPSAVLIRQGIVVDKNLKVLKLLKGPGILTRFLKIDKSFNGKEISLASNLWLENWGIRVSQFIKKGKRIGIDYAGKFWSQRNWRFYLDLSSFLKEKN
ncbi:MAG: DNA-3-methyladenine glycosylase [Patescibacteria group bacterium]|nr:DNA-3-methyladenine glycosylase [Patescibacteria group bacterium]